MADSEAAKIFSVESTIVTDVFEQEDTRETARPLKKARIDEDNFHHSLQNESGVFSNIPPEVIHHILRFLSAQDLLSCSNVCKLLCHAASDESLWRRLYCLRWSPESASSEPCASAWKKLYIQRDEEDVSVRFVNRPAKIQECFFQMQVALRNQAPPPSQVNDDDIILDITVANQLSDWISSRDFTDEFDESDESDESMTEHTCSRRMCTYSLNTDVYICVKTGCVHVCGDSCCDAVCHPCRGYLVCTISGRCFDIWASSEKEVVNRKPMYWWSYL